MNEGALEGVLLPILREMKEHLPRLVLIGGWVPQLHRRFGSGGGWSRDPISTIELDILLTKQAPGLGSKPLSDTLYKAGFRPVDENMPPAVWERDRAKGERIEFFVDHTGPAHDLGEVVGFASEKGIGGLSLDGLGFLRDHSTELEIPLREASEAIRIRVPTLPAFMVHKGAVFFRRKDATRRAKDLLYIVEIMAEGDPLVAEIEEGIQDLCKGTATSASVARTARNNVSLVLSQATSPLVAQASEALAIRHNWDLDQAEARARGFLSDFVHLIPEGCADGLG